MLPHDDDLGTPLHAVTFCVVDLETTGGSPASDTITEVGAATFRGGERLGTFQTLVDPGVPVPPDVSQLTGITDAMVRRAPAIGQVLPSLVEFAGPAVLVGHNLRFDTSFLDAALAATGRSLLDHRRVDTVALARRLVRDDVPDCRLGTLAAHLGLSHQPSHRALDDALATADLLHVLLERAASFGVVALDDLLALPDLAAHPHADKLRLTVRLPRAPGAYLVRNRRGEPLHAGHADDVRTQLRSYFSAAPDVPGVQRRAITPVLREAYTVEHLRAGSGLEAAVAATRLARALSPRHDRRSPRPSAYRYVTATTAGRGAAGLRLTVSRAPRPGVPCVAGPLPSTAAARLVVAAVEAAAPDPSDAPRTAGSGTARPGTAVAPAVGGLFPLPFPLPLDGLGGPDGLDAPGPSGAPGSAADRRAADGLAALVAGRPDVLVARLVDRADAWAAAGRYAAAAGARRHAVTLVETFRRQRRVDALRRAGRVVLALPDSGRAELVRGCLVRAWHADRSSVRWGDDAGSGAPATPAGERAPSRPALGDVALDGVSPPPADGPVPLDIVDELDCVSGWIERHADEVRVLYVEGELASVLPGLPTIATDDPTGAPTGGATDGDAERPESGSPPRAPGTYAHDDGPPLRSPAIAPAPAPALVPDPGDLVPAFAATPG